MSWVCHFCSTSNVDENEECFVCGKKKDEFSPALTEKTNIFSKTIKHVGLLLSKVLDGLKKCIIKIINSRINRHMEKISKLEDIISKLER